MTERELQKTKEDWFTKGYKYGAQAHKNGRFVMNGESDPDKVDEQVIFDEIWCGNATQIQTL
jgi:hypothetical protein